MSEHISAYIQWNSNTIETPTNICWIITYQRICSEKNPGISQSNGKLANPDLDLMVKRILAFGAFGLNFFPFQKKTRPWKGSKSISILILGGEFLSFTFFLELSCKYSYFEPEPVAIIYYVFRRKSFSQWSYICTVFRGRLLKSVSSVLARERFGENFIEPRKTIPTSVLYCVITWQVGNSFSVINCTLFMVQNDSRKKYFVAWDGVVIRKSIYLFQNSRKMSTMPIFRNSYLCTV